MLICESLDCNRSTTYHHCTQKSKDEPWLDQIVSILQTHPHYGIKRLYLSFKLQGITISQSKIRRICRSSGIVSKRRRSKPPDRDRNIPESKIPNLVKSLIQEDLIQKPDQVWSGDFSYLKIWGLWYYLATVIDVYTKEIVGFSISNNHNTELITKALKIAVNKNRKPNIFHSDQGSEYTSIIYQDILQNLNIQQSNSKKASPWENGYQESFYGKFKQELQIHRLQACNSYIEIYSMIAEQINYYNNQRIHTTIENTPSGFYKQCQLKMIEMGEMLEAN